MSDTCCACSSKAIAVVTDGSFQKPACESHGRMYRQQGYKVRLIKGEEA